MPRISQEAIPVQQAVLTPIGVDLGPGGQGLQAVGQAVSGIGRQLHRQQEAEKKVNEQLEKRRLEVVDTIGKSNAQSLRKQGLSEIEAFKETHPNPEEWIDGVKDIAKSIAKDHNELEMSDEARQIANAQLQSWADEQLALTRLDGIKRSAIDAVEATKANYIDALEGGDPEEIFEARLYIFQMLDNTVDEAERDNTLKELEKFGHEKRVLRIMDNIKPTLVDAIKLDDKQAGLAALDTITQQLVDEGQWTGVEAVQAPTGPLLVLAGAGTGKTRVVIARILHLVQQGTPPERILAGLGFPCGESSWMDRHLSGPLSSWAIPGRL